MSQLRIGTCSWRFPSWAGTVYSAPEGINHLQEYATKYDTVLDFVNFCQTHGKSVTWWGNSPAFDQIIMESLIRDSDLTFPWNFWKWRDVRTTRSYIRGTSKPPVTAHDPLADCLAQIDSVVTFYSEQAMIGILTEGL